MIRDDTMTCDTMNQCDASDIVMYLTTMYLNCRPPHVLYFWCCCFLTHHILLLYNYVRNKNIIIISR